MADCDVLVVGAGPVGLITALGLARAGASVTVLEAEPHIIVSPRAAVYHWSVLDGLERLGILADVEAAGIAKQDYTYFVPATGERIMFDIAVLGAVSAHPYNIHLGQHRLAEIARRHLERHAGSRVLFDTRVVELAQDSEGVTATTEAGQQWRADYVVGADGGGSSVRRLLGLSFDGMTWPERFVATNVRYDFERYGYSLTMMVIDAAHGAVIVKLDREGLWRVTYMEDDALPAATFMDRLPAAYAALLPGEGDYALDSAAPYRMHQRSAPRYRAGRVVLAGDAAHLTNSTGGLGLTGGLFDSYALYPALAAVLDGADDEVLDRYSAARRAIFLDRASPQAVANKRLIFHANGGGAELEEALAGLRRMADDADYRQERLMFTKSLESPPLLGEAVA